MSQQTYRLTNLLQQSSDQCLVIAHRGASAYYPENTMTAFQAALEMGADMIELDLMLSSDGVPVVFHDAKLDAHSNGQGLLSYHSLSELKELDAGSWFGSEFTGNKIPTLEEVLHFAAGKIALNIEIKTEAVTDEVLEGVEEKCLKLVRKFDMQQHVLFSSFDYRAVTHLKTLDSGIPVALLYNRGQSNGLSPAELVQKYRADAFNCSYRQLKNRWRPEINKLKVPHFVYTVDEEAKMKELLDTGVNGIFTNRPDRLKAVIQEHSNRNKT